MFGRILRFMCGLLALWGSDRFSDPIPRLIDEATGGNDIGITSGPQPAPKRLAQSSRPKKPDIFDEILELDAKERRARQEEEAKRRQPQKGDKDFFGEDPRLAAKRPENVAKLAEARHLRWWSEGAKYLGYGLILSAIFPGLWDRLCGKKPKSDAAQMPDSPETTIPTTPAVADDAPRMSRVKCPQKMLGNIDTARSSPADDGSLGDVSRSRIDR